MDRICVCVCACERTGWGGGWGGGYLAVTSLVVFSDSCMSVMRQCVGCHVTVMCEADMLAGLVFEAPSPDAERALP